MSKTCKTKAAELSVPDSKPVHLAKILYPAIVRYIKAQRSLTVEKKPKFSLDSGDARRICVHSK